MGLYFPIYSDEDVRKAVFQAYNNTCQYCNTIFPDDELRIDHIDPTTLGGEWKIENYTAACYHCNSRKSGFKLPEPGRSLILGLAMRKKSEIIRRLKLPTIANGSWALSWEDAIKNTHLNQQDEFDEAVFGDIKIVWYWHINSFAIKLFHEIMAETPCESSNKSCTISLSEKRIIALSQEHNHKELIKALKWLSHLTIIKDAAITNAIIGYLALGDDSNIEMLEIYCPTIVYFNPEIQKLIGTPLIKIAVRN